MQCTCMSTSRSSTAVAKDLWPGLQGTFVIIATALVHKTDTEGYGTRSTSGSCRGGQRNTLVCRWRRNAYFAHHACLQNLNIMFLSSC